MREAFDPDRSLWDAIAVEVRRLRECHGLSVSQLASRLRVDRSTVSRIEHGHRRLSPEQAEQLDIMWELRGLLKRLVRFASATDDGDWFTGLIEIEKDASLQRLWETLVVPGLLQTPDYARALIAAGKQELEQSLERRLARQTAVFDRKSAPRVSVILNWVILEHHVGSVDVMKGQLAHLLELGERPNVHIRIMEKTSGAHMGLDGSFRLLTVGGREIAFSSSPERGRLVLEPSDVWEYAVRYDQISNLAVPTGASRRLIEQTMEEL
ncbi:helix-turn-helix transcriptional regulator [Actinomadura sp. NPDC047616]|uniref:helix-turn-helix domain-containing protein n=1 Tax=Actinomadura sp. NPDC047616 TaxID=3155914 RepID=UPI00340FE81D